MRTYLQILLLLLSLTIVGALCPRSASAQVQTPAEPAGEVAPDSAGVSASGAFLRSLVIPGWGQSYVGSPGRGAVYFALEGGSLWMTFKSWHRLRQARQLERFQREQELLQPGEEFGLVESRERQLEDWITLSVFLLLFSGADAYVAAQLADFSEHIGVLPDPGGGVQLEARLPLGGVR